MRDLPQRVLRTAWSAFLAFLILGTGQGIWGALLICNLKTSPSIPWAVPAMAVVLWVIWQYLGGKWWPRTTSEKRRDYLRANRVPGEVMVWAFVAGLLAIVALAGYWIVLFQLVRTPPNALADFSQYPALMTVLAIGMASLVSPITEEAAFRGYCQVILEREYAEPVAVLISSIFFALAHLTQGFFWTKLLVYFLVGIVFGVIAYLTQSTLPALPVHIAGDLMFFILVWPHDSNRPLIWDSGANRWFWIHSGQAILFTVLSVPAFLRLNQVAKNSIPGREKTSASLA